MRSFCHLILRLKLLNYFNRIIKMKRLCLLLNSIQMVYIYTKLKQWNSLETFSGSFLAGSPYLLNTCWPESYCVSPLLGYHLGYNRSNWVSWHCGHSDKKLNTWIMHPVVFQPSWIFYGCLLAVSGSHSPTCFSDCCWVLQ